MGTQTFRPRILHPVDVSNPIFEKIKANNPGLHVFMPA